MTARRNGSPPVDRAEPGRATACSHCAGIQRPVRQLLVRTAGDPHAEPVAIALCGLCRELPGATWRRRWEPVSS